LSRGFAAQTGRHRTTDRRLPFETLALKKHWQKNRRKNFCRDLPAGVQ
jgi:hypothetical protein